MVTHSGTATNQFYAYERAAGSRGTVHPVWLVANLGFNRSGYRRPEELERFAARAAACRHLAVQGVYAHLTHANGDADLSRAQIAEFDATARRACRAVGSRLETSLFASHGLVRWPGRRPARTLIGWDPVPRSDLREKHDGAPEPFDHDAHR